MRVVKAQVTKTGESPSLATASGRLRRLASIAGSAPWHRPAALLWNWRFSTAASAVGTMAVARSEEHTSELQSRPHLVCRLLLEKKKRRYSPHILDLVQ